MSMMLITLNHQHEHGLYSRSPNSSSTAVQLFVCLESLSDVLYVELVWLFQKNSDNLRMVGRLEQPGAEQAKEREAEPDKDVLGPVVHEDDVPNIKESVTTQDPNKRLRDPLPEPKVQFSKQLMVFRVPAGLLLLAQRLPRLLCLLRVLRQ